MKNGEKTEPGSFTTNFTKKKISRRMLEDSTGSSASPRIFPKIENKKRSKIKINEISKKPPTHTHTL